MKHAIVVKSGSRVIGVYTNLKRFWDSLGHNQTRQHYATACLHLRYHKPYDVGTCVVDCQVLENVRLEKFECNKLLQPANM